MKTELHKVSTTVLCAIVVFAFSIGAVCAGWATGIFSTKGNAADWFAALCGAVAALGTWAIGIGANNYAREAHLQRVAERAAQDKQERDALRRRYSVMKLKLIGLTYEHDAFCATNDAASFDDLNRFTLEARSVALLHRLGRAEFAPEEFVLLEEDARRSYKIVELQTQLVAQLLDMAIKDEGDTFVVFVRSAAEDLKRLAVVAEDCLTLVDADMEAALALDP